MDNKIDTTIKSNDFTRRNFKTVQRTSISVNRGRFAGWGRESSYGRLGRNADDWSIRNKNNSIELLPKGVRQNEEIGKNVSLRTS